MSTKEAKELYPILPLRNTVLFPQQIIPIYVGREQSLKLVDNLKGSKNKHIVVVAQKDSSVEVPDINDLYEWGTLANIMKVFDMPDGSKSAIVQGLERVKIESKVDSDTYLNAMVTRNQEIFEYGTELDSMTANLHAIFRKLIDIAPYLSDEQADILTSIQNPGKLADKSISLINIPIREKQEILASFDVKKRLEKTNVIITREIQRIQLGEKIQSEVQDEISKSQREYYLREQMKAIQKELGEDEPSVELDEIRKKVDEAKMPKDINKVAIKELNRLKKIPSHSPEYTVSRTYLDWLTDLPWSKRSEDKKDIDFAKKTLDRDHYGLEKIKERILEHLAVRNFKMSRSKKNESFKSPILCFTGPPGTGKTSIGKSIADAMGRKFVRISLGGVRDEAEIRGHRRTYIGALPGRIIASLKKAGTKNPIFMLDEIDKLGTDFRGDPSSALLEVLDPEQNFSFNDHYLEVDFDLSEVMFITTANRMDQIPGPLRDRMEILDFSGYILDEKVEIAKDHLIPKQVKEHALKKNEISFIDDGLKLLVDSYTREAGVRNLEREIANLCRKVAKDISTGHKKSVKLTNETILDYLGPEKFFSEVAERLSKPGVAIGLAWTGFGGDILFIEATKMPGKGVFKMTGKLGDVMKESAEAAYSYVRANCDKFNIEKDFYKKNDIHIHVPAGAIPKDGPSAGVTMATALISLLTNRLVKSEFGMTGEISLRGMVLPIGGLKEKSTAAHRSGLKHILAPYLNKRDLEEIPERVRKDLKITFVKEVEEVIKLALA
jgi:ATP-dependent Lon protease